MPKPGPRTTHRYSAEFKATAVRLSQLPGVSVSDVAESLYIHPFMLSRWRRLAREGQIMTRSVDVGPGVAAELKELRQVKKQYERLPAFIVGGLLGGQLVGVLVGNIPYAVAGGVLIAPLAWFVFAGRRAIRQAPDTDAGH